MCVHRMCVCVFVCVWVQGLLGLEGLGLSFQTKWETSFQLLLKSKKDLA